MPVTDEIFEAFLNCETKAYLKLSGTAQIQNDVVDWQRHILEDYKQKCLTHLRSNFTADKCFVGASNPQALEDSKNT